MRSPRRIGRTLAIAVAIAAWITAGAAGMRPASASGGPPIAEQLSQTRRAAVAAYRAGDYATARLAIEAAVSLVPNNANTIYTLASLRARTGDTSGALSALEQIASMGLAYEAESDSDFVALRDDAAFRAVLEQFRRNRLPIGSAEVAFRLTEKDFIPEGIAFDEVERYFFVGSVHLRKIVKCSPGWDAYDFATGHAAGLMSVLGMKVDSDRRLLWAASNGLPQMTAFDSTKDGVAEIAVFSLRDGSRIATRPLPPREGGRLIGDLYVDRSGSAHLADSRSGEILVMRDPADSARTLLPAGRLLSLQGIDAFPGDTGLFAADYILGIVWIHPRTGAFRILPAPPDVCTSGIDGLYCRGHSIVGIQNGVRPHRIVQFHLDAKRERITGADVLLQGHPDFDEPTFGVKVGSDLYFVANSHWGAFDETGRLVSPDSLTPPAILKIAVPGPPAPKSVQE